MERPMWRCWKVVEVKPDTGRSTWNEAARTKLKQRELSKGHITSRPEPGVHYFAKEAPNRILLPNIPQLQGMRNRWVWEKRNRPYVPVFEKCKMPDKRHHHEENARLFCVYYRPWCLNQQDASPSNPLLTDLALSHRQYTTADAARSYARSWEWYTSGNIVSEGARRYITNVLNMTAARASEKPDDAASSSSDDDSDQDRSMVGGMELVRRALDGRVRHDGSDDMILGFGKHSAAIGLAKDMWQSPERTPEELNDVAEKVFADDAFPKGVVITKTLQKVRQKRADRPKPFRGYTEPYCTLVVSEYAKRIDAWFLQVRERKTSLAFAAKTLDDLGVVLDDTSGKVTRISANKLFHAQYVRVGWRIEAVNGQPYSKALLDGSIVSGSHVTLTFDNLFRRQRWEQHELKP